MRWVLLALILLCLPSVFAVNPTISIDPPSGPLNTDVIVAAAISPDVDGDLYIYSNQGLELSFKSCVAGTTCSLGYETTITSENSGFYAEYFTGTTAPTSNTVFFDVTDNPPPFVNYFFAPEDGAISVPLSFEFSVGDDSQVDRVIIDFDDGSIPVEVACSANPCLDNGDVMYTYESPGTYNVSITAFDDQEAQMPKSLREVRVSGELDSDQDGIPDEADVCPNTAAANVQYVAISGEHIGCACAEIDVDDFDDGNLCTSESCSLVAGELVIAHTPIPTGGSPNGLSGTCNEDGQYVSSQCDAGDATVCFGNRGNEQPYCFDGSTFYEQVDTCDSSETCKVNADGDALCVEGDACSALYSPGCRVDIPLNAVERSATCDFGQACYQCQDGFEWTGTSCEESLDCSTYYYLDADGDGQGAGRGQCIEFRDSVTDNRDCNDNNPDAYVGATELCNNVDNDCDGVVGLEDPFCVDVVYDHCTKDSEVETVWIRDDQLTCVEFEKTKTTSYNAVSPECEYEEKVILTSNEKSRFLPDGTSCPTGFCNDGQCVPSCEHQCLSEKPANSIEVTAQSCSGTNSCYKCANNMIWDGNKCVNTGYQIVNVGSMTVQD